MLIPTFALLNITQSELDHRTALAIWNRARNAHGFNSKTQNALAWSHQDESKTIKFFIHDFGYIFELTTADQYLSYRSMSSDIPNPKCLDAYFLRTEFLKHPAGILTCPPQAITKSPSPDAFSLTVKGITIDVYLDPKTDRIDYIEYLDPTPGTRKYSNYTSNEDYIRPATLRLPETWRSGPDLKHLGDPFNVIYSLNSCRGFSPWIPEAFDYKTPDLGGTGF
jgi:hypothetical protein